MLLWCMGPEDELSRLTKKLSDEQAAREKASKDKHKESEQTPTEDPRITKALENQVPDGEVGDGMTGEFSKKARKNTTDRSRRPRG